ncbi:hypothetical protein [Roseobacter sp. AzwK-3b]|uniref:hypothetical protein n=1 Tax=Roseobacter sp. AzwK-3b TaxID=351016 RepID=UPI00056A56DF|nr:hypothetical protein [Roseobacter sp. AzwK-3b]
MAYDQNKGISRRRMLARLGLTTGAIYVAPVMMHLGAAHASGGSGGGAGGSGGGAGGSGGGSGPSGGFGGSRGSGPSGGGRSSGQGMGLGQAVRGALRGLGIN